MSAPDPASASSKQLTFKRVLSRDDEKKIICLECVAQIDASVVPAVVILEKMGFEDDFVKRIFVEFDLSNQNKELVKVLDNDIYSTYLLRNWDDLNKVKMTVICPATDKHLIKYSSIELNIVKETKDIYESVVKPYIAKSFLSTGWIDNVLDGTAEGEKYVFSYSDQVYGFVLLHDYNWDGTSLDCLHLLAIMRRGDIKSIRDINRSHVDYLNFITEKCFSIIENTFGLKRVSVRAFFHYPPSFYHLHIHFTNVAFTSCNISTDRAHLVHDVIDNVNMLEDYYQNKTLYYCLKVVDPLLGLVEEAASNSAA